MNQGWSCPNCNGAHAPWVASCPTGAGMGRPQWLTPNVGQTWWGVMPPTWTITTGTSTVSASTGSRGFYVGAVPWGRCGNTMCTEHLPAADGVGFCDSCRERYAAEIAEMTGPSLEQRMRGES